MTDTIPRPRDSEAGADASESDPLLVCAPLRIEARAILRGVRGGGKPPRDQGGSGGDRPPVEVLRTGYGTTRAARQAGELSHRPFGLNEIYPERTVVLVNG